MTNVITIQWHITLFVLSLITYLFGGILSPYRYYILRKFLFLIASLMILIFVYIQSIQTYNWTIDSTEAFVMVVTNYILILLSGYLFLTNLRNILV